MVLFAVSIFFLDFFFSESVEALPLLGLLVDEFSVSEEEDSLPEEEDEDEEDELLDDDESEADDPS